MITIYGSHWIIFISSVFPLLLYNYIYTCPYRCKPIRTTFKITEHELTIHFILIHPDCVYSGNYSLIIYNTMLSVAIYQSILLPRRALVFRVAVILSYLFCAAHVRVV